MLDRDFRLALRKELQGGKTPQIGIEELGQLKDLYEQCCSVGDKSNTTLMSTRKWIRFVKQHQLLGGDQDFPGACELAVVEADLIFLDIAKNSKRPQAQVNLRNVSATKLKLGWPDFLDCLCELSHMRYPKLNIREEAIQELLADVLDLY